MKHVKRCCKHVPSYLQPWSPILKTQPVQNRQLCYNGSFFFLNGIEKKSFLKFCNTILRFYTIVWFLFLWYRINPWLFFFPLIFNVNRCGDQFTWGHGIYVEHFNSIIKIRVSLIAHPKKVKWIKINQYNINIIQIYYCKTGSCCLELLLYLLYTSKTLECFLSIDL